MEDQMTSGQVGRKYGIIFGLVSAIIFIITAAARLNLGFFGTIIGWAVIITVFVLACKEYKRENGGYMAFGKGFSIVMIISLIGGILRAVIVYVYLLIDTEYLVFAKELRESSPFGPSPDQAQDMPAWTEFFNTGEFMAIVMVIGAIFGGLILGAIVAAIMKNEKEEF